LNYHRVQCAILVMRRAEPAQPRVRLLRDSIENGGGQSRLADSGLASNEDDTSLCGLCLLPPPQHQLQFLVAANQRCSFRAQRLKPACGTTLADDPPGTLRRSEPGKSLR